MKSERDRFVALAFCWADVTLELDQDRRVVFAGGITDALFGQSVASLRGMPFEDLVVPEDRGLTGELFGLATRRGRIDTVTIRFVARRGGVVPLAMAGYCLPDMDSHFFLGLRVSQITNPLNPELRLSRDVTSGLYEADSFTDVATDRLRSTPDQDRMLTVVELDRLEELGGRVDQETFDNLQRTIGACLRANSADGDSAGRITQNRYGLVHSSALDVDDLERKIAGYAAAADPTGEGVQVRAATVTVDFQALSEEDIAKGLLYVINRARQSQSERFTLSNLSRNLSAMVREATDTVDGFKRLVARSDFEMAFQPIMDIGTGKPHHYEVLARFPSGRDEGSPYRFITFAEEMGLIAEFDMAMVRKSLDWLVRYHEDGYQVAVNLSGFSVTIPSFIAELQHLLTRNTWARGALMFEITESARIEDLGAVNRFIQTLRKNGHAVCLDDFGAGAANFQYLSTLEVDVVKLDGEALRQARAGRRGKAFIKALTALCQELRIDVVAEMIDDEEGLRFVRECGIRYVQGYYFAKPSRDISVFTDSKRMARMKTRQEKTP